MKKKEIKSAVKKISKDIRAINKKIKDDTELSCIEKNYLLKNEIKNYYHQNQYKISDDVLVAVYDETYQPSVMGELSIGVFSGMLASLMIEYSLHLLPDFQKDSVLIMIVQGIVYLFLILFGIVLFVFGLLKAYKEIRASYTYSDEVNDFYKSFLKELIAKRETKLQKESVDEQRNKKKNRKHK